MATTVNTAFNEFMSNKVNLDQDKTKRARSSRDWLVAQIHNFDSKNGFPILYKEIDLDFGSFSRRTKIRELDDIDMMIGLNAQDGTYLDLGEFIEITVSNNSNNLLNLCHDNTKNLNSRKVVNIFLKNLYEIPQYENAVINRRGEAATLKLKSYTWNFDIVPCFFTNPDNDGRSYYLIPDGKGNWKKTNPVIDYERVKKINQKHNGKVLNVIRIMKYWNRRAAIPNIGSYFFECMLLDYYSSKESCSEYIDLEVKDVFHHICTAIYDTIADPKLIQGNLNLLSIDEKAKISGKAYTDWIKAEEAWKMERVGDQKSAVRLWKEIFGNDFPDFTG